MGYKDVDRWVTKQINRAQQAAPDYAAGARATDRDPTAEAIKAQPKWIARLQERETQDKYARGLQRAGKAGWLAGVENKGVQRYAPGVAAAEPKIRDFATKFSSHLGTAVPQVRAMGSTSYEERKARAIKMMDLNHGFKR